MRIAADHIWQSGALHGPALVEIEGGTIAAVRPGQHVDADRRVHVLMPGCTDLQVNGGGGVMVNSSPSAEGLAQIIAAHRGLGTHWIMPTVITDAPEVLDAAASAAIAMRGTRGFLGLHVEGPHINPAKRGTHDARFIRPLDARSMAVLHRLRQHDIPVILTLAPELAAPADLARLREMGVTISAGHSAANADQARAGLTAGVSMFTHLFNAMPPMAHRDPGLAAVAILSEAYCGLIADGIHVSWEMLRLALAARPRPDRMFLVSDAMATVGGPDHFTLYGQDIHVKGGALVNAEGSLAGAHIDMVRSLRNLVRHAAVSLERAIAMATDIPRAAIGLPPQPAVTQGAPFDELIALDHDLHLMSLT